MLPKTNILAIVATALAVVLAAVVVFFFLKNSSLSKENESLQKDKEGMEELVEMNKIELENQYEQFTMQYGEIITSINNDSIIAQLTREQMRTKKLLEELKQTKATDAKEIASLKKELETVRAVLRSYIRQVDSLNQVNQTLVLENDEIKDQLEQSNRLNEGLQEEKQKLTEQVTIAAQLDATGIGMTILNKRNKVAKKMKDCKTIQIGFNISRNVTAANGQRTVYVRIQTPSGEVLNGGGTFPYENRQLEYSMKKVIEYTGEEMNVLTYWTVNEFLSTGSYRVSIFADGNMIGSKTFNFEK